MADNGRDAVHSLLKEEVSAVEFVERELGLVARNVSKWLFNEWKLDPAKHTWVLMRFASELFHK